MKLTKFFAATAIICSITVSCSGSKKPTINGVNPPSEELCDSVSYLLGVNYAAMAKGNGFAEAIDELNLAEIKKGMEDFFNAEGEPNPYDPEFTGQFKINLNQMDRIINDYLQKKIAYKNAESKQKEDQFLSKNALKENVDTTASGLQYTIVSAGADYKVQPKDTVLVNYKGQLIDGKVFDQNDSMKFVANQVIIGWTEGLGLLGEGGKATLFIPSKLGYGERGTRGIPGFSTLIFDIEVIKVMPFVSEEE